MGGRNERKIQVCEERIEKTEQEATEKQRRRQMEVGEKERREEGGKRLTEKSSLDRTEKE